MGGTASGLTQANYLAKGNRIGSVAPGVMFYYRNFLAPSSAFTFTVEQENAGSCGEWQPIRPQDLGQINLYDAACGNRIATTNYDDTTGLVTISVEGATAGETLVVGIKYDLSSLAQKASQQAICNPRPTQVYSFSDSSGGSATLSLVPKAGK
jgi:hypothetical protein